MFYKNFPLFLVRNVERHFTNVEEIPLWCAVFKEIYLKIYLRLLDKYKSTFYRTSVFQTDIFAQTPVNFFFINGSDIFYVKSISVSYDIY